jgi:pimeloyl-ACP methyl ester carboxylesterase
MVACGSPVRAVRVDPMVARRDLTRSVLTTGEASWATRVVLLERGILEGFDKRPAETIAELHREMVAENANPDLLFALAELSFLYGQAARKHEYDLAAAVYAYAFLFPEDGESRAGPLDPRLRNAADLYNWSLTAAFASRDGTEFDPHGGSRWLPFGWVGVEFDPSDLRAGNRELYRFVPLAEFEVEGLAMRYRVSGIGAPLAASTRPAEGAPPGVDMVARALQVPVTALLRIPHPRRALLEGRPFKADLELHLAWDDDAVVIAGDTVPLESEPTAALALTFTDVPVLQLEILGFLGRFTGLGTTEPTLMATTPYREGLVPVVFVHGTASSPLRWAEMYNRLHADPELRSRYQFWFFRYNSDAPIALSALGLREALSAAVEQLDPDGKDLALRQMVLIGHSQGGLLVKMQSISSGDQIWNAVATKPIDELDLSDEARALLKRGLFVEPLPDVSRVVFISTPHRGSFIAGSAVIANLVRRLTTLPVRIGGMSSELNRNLAAARSSFVPTAVDNMSPGSPFIEGLQQIPVAPSIPAHSIISVDGTGPVEEGDDGVVEYSSAHIDEAVSEFIVRSPHSCQAKPDTMGEVRRILRLHVGLPTVGSNPADSPY